MAEQPATISCMMHRQYFSMHDMPKLAKVPSTIKYRPRQSRIKPEQVGRSQRHTVNKLAFTSALQSVQDSQMRQRHVTLRFQPTNTLITHQRHAWTRLRPSKRSTHAQQQRLGMSLATMPTTKKIDIVLPVYNEEAAITNCVYTICAFMSLHAYDWRITIADNGSTDKTAEISQDLAIRMSTRVSSLRIEQKGRGGALRAAWEACEGDVVCYMDADLSTGLEALPALLDVSC